MATRGKTRIGLFISLLGPVIILVTILVFYLFVEHKSDAGEFAFVAFVFTGFTLIWLGIFITYIFKSLNTKMMIFRILATMGFLLVFYISPVLLFFTEVAGGLLFSGVVLSVVGFVGSSINMEYVKQLPYTLKADRPAFTSIVGITVLKHTCYLCRKELSKIKNKHSVEDCITKYHFCESCAKTWLTKHREHVEKMMFSGQSIMDAFQIPLVITHGPEGLKGLMHVGELVFTSKGVCFMNTSFYKHFPVKWTFYLGVGGAVLFPWNMLIGTSCLLFFGGLAGFLKNRNRRERGKAIIEKEKILANCENFSDKFAASKHVFVIEKEEITEIFGNKNQLAITSKSSKKPSEFQIELGGYQEYEAKINSYLGENLGEN